MDSLSNHANGIKSNSTRTWQVIVGPSVPNAKLDTVVCLSRQKFKTEDRMFTECKKCGAMTNSETGLCPECAAEFNAVSNLETMAETFDFPTVALLGEDLLAKRISVVEYVGALTELVFGA
jgi:hypothetical protein